MHFRWITRLFGGAVGALTAGVGIARAQQSSGGTIDLGGSIADTVTGAVSSIATNSGGSVTGGTQVEHSEVSLGEQQGLAVADASGGDHNVSFAS